MLRVTTESTKSTSHSVFADGSWAIYLGTNVLTEVPDAGRQPHWETALPKSHFGLNRWALRKALEELSTFCFMSGSSYATLTDRNIVAVQICSVHPTSINLKE